MPGASAGTWVRFFTNAGIPSQAAAGYAHVFVENRIQMDMLMDLNREYLREMGITTMGDIIAILRHSKAVSEQTVRDKVLATPAEADHGNTSVPVAAVSATQSSMPKSVISRPSSAVSLPSKPRRIFSEHKVTLPVTEGSGKVNEGPDKKAQLMSTVGSLNKKAGVFKRLSHDSEGDDDVDIDEDVDEDDDELEPPSKLASKVMLKVSSGNSSSIFSRLGGKSKREAGDIPTGILKKTPTKMVHVARRVTTDSKKVILVKKIPAKAANVSDDDDMTRKNNARYRDFDRMDTGEPQKSVSFSKEDEVLEIDPRPPVKPLIKPRPRLRFHERELPIKARLGHTTNYKQHMSPLRGTKKTIHLKPPKIVAGNVTTLSPLALARSKMKSDAMLLRKESSIKNRLNLGTRSPPPHHIKPTYRTDRFNLDTKLANMRLKGSPRKSPGRYPSQDGVVGGSVFDRLGYSRK